MTPLAALLTSSGTTCGFQVLVLKSRTRLTDVTGIGPVLRSSSAVQLSQPQVLQNRVLKMTQREL